MEKNLLNSFYENFLSIHFMKIKLLKFIQGKLQYPLPGGAVVGFGLGTTLPDHMTDWVPSRSVGTRNRDQLERSCRSAQKYPLFRSLFTFQNFCGHVVGDLDPPPPLQPCIKGAT